MTKALRISAPVLIASLCLFNVRPATASHVISAISGRNLLGVGSFALTETGEVYYKDVDWTLIGTHPGAFALTGFDFEGSGNGEIWLLGFEGEADVYRYLVTDLGIGSPVYITPVCSPSPIRSFSLRRDYGFVSMSVIHEDGLICFGGSPVGGPPEPEPTGARNPVPGGFALHQNVPNPFNPMTAIQYDAPDGGARVTLRIYDVEGRLVHTLVDRVEGPGEKRAAWDGRDGRGIPVASGTYFYTMTAAGFTETRKMVLIK